MQRSVAVLGSAIGCALLLAPTALAQPTGPDDRNRALARDLFNQGVEAATAESWETAYECFRDAHRLVPDVTPILFNLCAAASETGRVVEGAELCREYLRRPDADHREEARALLDGILPRIGRLRIALNEHYQGDRIELDGQPVNEASLEREMPVDPGRRRVTVVRVTVVRGDQVVAEQDVEIDEGGSGAVELEVPEPPPPPAVDLRAGGGAPSRDESRSIFASPWFWVVTVAVLGAAGGVALAFALQPQPTTGNIGDGRPLEI